MSMVPPGSEADGNASYSTMAVDEGDRPMSAWEQRMADACRTIGAVLAEQCKGIETMCLDADGNRTPIGALSVTAELDTEHGTYWVTCSLSSEQPAD